jgi:hypothetical protein
LDNHYLFKIEFEVHYYDEYSKLCVSGLLELIYRCLKTGVAASMGMNRSGELADVFGKGKRICDVLCDLDGVVVGGREVKAGFQVEIVTRARGDEAFFGLAVIMADCRAFALRLLRSGISFSYAFVPAFSEKARRLSECFSSSGRGFNESKRTALAAFG